MPPRLLRPCCEPGCPTLVQKGRCPQHTRAARAEYESRPERREQLRFYASPAWRALRVKVLAASPSCVGCGAPATEVDHILPVSEGGPLLDEGNLRPLCRRCHSSRTMRDQWRRGELGRP